MKNNSLSTSSAFHLKKNSMPSSPQGPQGNQMINGGLQENNQVIRAVGGKQIMVNTSAKSNIQSSHHNGSMTTKNQDNQSHKRQGSNFFKELTNSLYDGKSNNGNGGIGSVLVNQSRQNVNNNNQAISAMIGVSGLSSKNSIIMVPNSNVKMNSIGGGGHQRRDSQQNENSISMMQNSLHNQQQVQQSPLNQTQNSKMAQLKKKFSTSGMQAIHNGNQPSLSNQSSSCNVTLSQSSQQKPINSVQISTSAVGSRKNSKDQQQANKPYVNSKSPTPISILSQYSNQSRQPGINNIPATLSPKDMNGRGIVFKANAPSPSNSILLQGQQSQSRQSQQSPLNATQKKSSQQVMISVNSNQSISKGSTNQIFQKVYELKKKYQINDQNIQGAHSVASAPISKVSSPDTRNQSTHQGYQINQSNYSSNTNHSSHTNLGNQQPLMNNYISNGKKQDCGISKGNINMQQNQQLFEQDQQQQRLFYEINSRSPVSSTSNLIQSQKGYSPSSSQHHKIKNPKEMIIQHIGKYIQKKNSQANNQPCQDDQVVNEDILQNLREFLAYLEEKNIINTSKLENNKEEMNNLIKDLMKLDLAKFSKPRCNSGQRRGSASPSVGGVNVQIDSNFQGHQNHNHNLFNQRHNSQNVPNSQAHFILNPHNDSKGQDDRSYQKMNNNSNSGSNSRQVPTIQLMINTNVNNFCITPVGSQSNKSSTKNLNNVTNNYNIYPGNPSPQQEVIPQSQPPKSNGLVIQRRGSDSSVIMQQQQQQNLKSQQPQTLMQGISQQQQQLNSHKRNVSDNNTLINKSSKQTSTRQSENGKSSNAPAHKKNMPSVDPNNVSRNAESKNNTSQQNVSELQKSVLSANPDEQDPNNQVTLNESILNEREKIIKFIKAYIKRHNEIPPTTLDYYKFVKLIGKGAFGKVTLGIHKLTGKYVAIKTIDKSYMKDEYSRRKVFQEVYILKKIRHSCVIRLLEVFESPKHFLMVMEYAGGGDLLQYVKKRKRLDEDTSRAIFKQIVYGLGHCHCRSVLHRDVKLDNVLMDGEGGVKLCDFGVSRLVKKHHIIKEQCGTPAYLAPEIIIDAGYEGYYADVWSLGVLLYAMLQGTVPFKANNIADLHKLILKGDFDFAHPGISEDAKDLIRRMLVLTPEQRISIPEMLNHPWVREPNDCLEEEDDEHDLKVGATFFRQECMNGIIGPGNGGQMESGNINFINVENLYYKSSNQQQAENENGAPQQQQSKIKYSDYCALTEDFMTYRIDEEALGIVESYGYSRKLIIDSINKGEINHATASYYLLIHSTTQ